jgi:sodium-coupled neutral amino acid transporter 11
MSKAIVGAGAFGIPLAFQKTGFLTCIIIIIALGMLTYWTFKILLEAALRAKTYSYHDLMYHCFGTNGNRLYSLIAFLFAWYYCFDIRGCMLAYTIILGDTVPVIVRIIFGISDNTEMSFFTKLMTDRRIITIICSYMIIYPIACARYSPF